MNMRFVPCALLIFWFHMAVGNTFQATQQQPSMPAMQRLAMMTKYLLFMQKCAGAIVEHNLPVELHSLTTLDSCVCIQTPR